MNRKQFILSILAGIPFIGHWFKLEEAVGIFIGDTEYPSLGAAYDVVEIGDVITIFNKEPVYVVAIGDKNDPSKKYLSFRPEPVHVRFDHSETVFTYNSGRDPQFIINSYGHDSNIPHGKCTTL